MDPSDCFEIKSAAQWKVLSSRVTWKNENNNNDECTDKSNDENKKKLRRNHRKSRNIIPKR